MVLRHLESLCPATVLAGNQGPDQKMRQRQQWGRLCSTLTVQFHLASSNMSKQSESHFPSQPNCQELHLVRQITQKFVSKYTIDAKVAVRLATRNAAV